MRKFSKVIALLSILSLLFLAFSQDISSKNRGMGYIDPGPAHSVDR